MLCSMNNKIKSCRELRKLSIGELAGFVGIESDILEKIELGEIEPSKDLLLDLGEVLEEDLVNERPLKNITIFDLLDAFYNLQIQFTKFKKLCIGTQEYNQLLNECVYRKGLIYPKALGDFDCVFSDQEIRLFRAYIKILSLKMSLILEKRG